MPTYKVPVKVTTILTVEAESFSVAENGILEKVAGCFPGGGTVVDIVDASVKSAYEVGVTFYMNGFSTVEVEDRIHTLVSEALKNEKELSFDVEAIRQGGPCRG